METVSSNDSGYRSFINGGNRGACRFLLHIFSGTLEEQVGQNALNLAHSVAESPEIQAGFDDDHPSETIQPVTQRILERTGAEFIVVGNRQSVRYSHPETVEEALRAGIFDYIIKPIQLERLDDSLQQFLRKQEFLEEQVDLDQSSIDFLVQNRENKGQELPKGIDSQTLKIIQDVFDDGTEACSASETARITGVSRPTARRYLEYLVSVNELSFSSSYGEPKRPQRLYRKK